MAARTLQVASGTTDVQAYTGGTRLLGFSFRENAGSAAAATIILRDGEADTAPIVYVIELAADESRGEWFPGGGIAITDGVFVEKAAGTTQGTVFVG